METNKRRSRIANWPVQRRFVVEMLFRWSLLTAVVGATCLLMHLFTAPVENQQVWWDSLRSSLIWFCLTMLVLTPILVYDAIKLSHRFVGPIVRVERQLRDMIEERYEEVRFRKDDFWLTLADTLNQLQRTIQARSGAEMTTSGKAGQN
jgi:hypothetical protein